MKSCSNVSRGRFTEGCRNMKGTAPSQEYQNDFQSGGDLVTRVGDKLR